MTRPSTAWLCPLLLLAGCAVEDDPLALDGRDLPLVEEEDLCITCGEPFMVPGEQVEVIVTLDGGPDSGAWSRRVYELEASCEGVACEIELEPSDTGTYTGTRYLRFRVLEEGDARISYTVIDVERDQRFEHRLPIQLVREPDSLTAHCLTRDAAASQLEPCPPGPLAADTEVHLAFLAHAGDLHRPVRPDALETTRPFEGYQWDDLRRLIGDDQPSWGYTATWSPAPGFVEVVARWRGLEVLTGFTLQ